MFCKNCGKEIDDRAAICPACGVPVQGADKEKPRNKTGSGLCIAGFIVSLLSLWLGMYFCIASIVAVVLSAIGMNIAKKNGYSCGLGIAGLVIGIISLVIWIFVLAFAASLILAFLS